MKIPWLIVCGYIIKLIVDRTENIAGECGEYQTDTNSKYILTVTRYLLNHERVEDIPTFYIFRNVSLISEAIPRHKLI